MTRPPRRIDHLVLAVHDLENAADFYTRMGFQVGARNRHPWGTENRLIQFRSSFLELITVTDAGRVPPHAPGFFSFGAFVADYLTKREGLAMLALDSSDAAADAAQFEREGIAEFQPFSFERAGRQPDGTQIRVAFSLAFARRPASRRRLLRLPATPSRSVLESAAPAPPEPGEPDRGRNLGCGKPGRPRRLPSRIHRRAAVPGRVSLPARRRRAARNRDAVGRARLHRIQHRRSRSRPRGATTDCRARPVPDPPGPP